MPRPRLFLDTNILVDAASGRIPPEEWRVVSGHIRDNYQHRISSVAFKELLVKLARGNDQDFLRNQEPLHVLRRLGNEHLAYPPVFVVRHVLGEQLPDFTDEAWGKGVLNLVLGGSKKSDLEAGLYRKDGTSSRKWKFDLDHFNHHETEPQTEHAAILEGLRDGSTSWPTREAWADCSSLT